MRAFVALEMSGPVVDALTEFQGALSSTGADIKLVERENLHINLKFLGEISGHQAAEAGARLEKVSATGGVVEVRGAGGFPTISSPRVVWAGVSKESEGLVLPIAQQVIRLLENIGERDDRTYRPHITLGRVRSSRNLRLLVDLLKESHDQQFGAVRVSEIKLKSSTLTSAGPVYQDLGVYSLA